MVAWYLDRFYSVNEAVCGWTKNYGERAFSFCGSKLWNDLPSSIKQATSVDIFKKDLKTFLFNKDVNF